MKASSPLFLAALYLLQISDNNSQCFDNIVDYSYNNNVTYTCNCIRDNEDHRQEMCLEVIVALSCPVSCGKCCKNDFNFKFFLGNWERAKCSFITNPQKRNKYCEDTGKGTQLVKNACTKSCKNFVSEVTNVPALSPTIRALTDTSTAKEDCVDNDAYIYGKNVD